MISVSSLIHHHERSELGAYWALGMAGTDANPGGGPSRIDTLHEQTPPWGATLGVVAEGSR